MSRPRKLRTVCSIPDTNSFGPRNGMMDPLNTVTMTIDEYETIRLIDWEGMLQEACAVQMNVARTTAQSIYSEARKKIADALVNRKWLVISGGDIVLCDGMGHRCGQRGCLRHPHNHGLITESDEKKQ